MNQENISLETKRLRLVPMTYDFVLKVIANDLSVYELLGVTKTETWPENTDIKEILHIIRDSLKDKTKPDGFDAWLFISKENHTIVGDGGFKGLPDENGVIDMGYAIVEAERQKGLALEAVSALLNWGLLQNGVNAVTADCLHDNIPSIKILTKIGMQEVERKDGMIFFRINKQKLLAN